MSVAKVPKLDRAPTSACAKNKQGPKPEERNLCGDDLVIAHKTFVCWVYRLSSSFLEA